jgi:hypothetical protein
MTKKEHYIPQLLLKNFSTKDRDQYRINLYDFERDEFRKNQNIKDVCAENYLYDKDNSIESFLDKYVESPAYESISHILKLPDSYNNPPCIELLRFIYVLLTRTPGFFEQIQALVDAFTGTVFKELALLNGYEKESIEKLHLVPNQPSSIYAYQIMNALLDWPLISDLSFHLAINRTSNEFILSDHPVFVYNWYLRDSKKLSATSISNLGVQIFLPLSPTLTYCLYDNKVYVYGSGRQVFSMIDNIDDVEVLNSFQALNSTNYLICHSIEMETSLKCLGKKYQSMNTYKSHAFNTPPTDIGNNQLKSTHVTWRIQTSVSNMPSFVKIKNKVRRRPIACRERNPDAVIAHDLFKKKLIKSDNAA